MKGVVFYHSATGNTKLGLEILALAMKKAGKTLELVSFSGAKYHNYTSYDFIGVGSPVFGWHSSPVVDAALDKLKMFAGKPAFVFMTCAMFPDNAAVMLSNDVKARGLKVLTKHVSTFEDSFTPTRFSVYIHNQGKPGKKEAQEIAGFANKLGKLLDRFNNGEQVPEDNEMLIPTPFTLIAQAARPPVLRALMGNRVVSSACDMCKICMHECPVGAIKMNPYPSFNDRCIGCWACVNICPTDAIISPFANGRPTYKGPKKTAEELLA